MNSAHSPGCTGKSSLPRARSNPLLEQSCLGNCETLLLALTCLHLLRPRDSPPGLLWTFCLSMAIAYALRSPYSEPSDAIHAAPCPAPCGSTRFRIDRSLPASTKLLWPEGRSGCRRCRPQSNARRRPPRLCPPAQHCCVIHLGHGKTPPSLDPCNNATPNRTDYPRRLLKIFA